MDARDFDDDRRVIQRGKSVVLTDGREFTHKAIFEEFFRTGLEKDYVRMGLGLIAVNTPISIVFETKESNEPTIDVEGLIERKEFQEREKRRKKGEIVYEEVPFIVNGVSSTDEDFYKELLKSDTVYNFS